MPAIITDTYKKQLQAIVEISNIEINDSEVEDEIPLVEVETPIVKVETNEEDKINLEKEIEQKKLDTEAKELADSLNGYLNIYKNYMLSSLRAIDYFETISSGKKCNDEGCEI